MDKSQIRSDLEDCLLTKQELITSNWQEGFEDNWPVERAYAL